MSGIAQKNRYVYSIQALIHRRREGCQLDPIK
jgi:hypothetical protein